MAKKTQHDRNLQIILSEVRAARLWIEQGHTKTAHQALVNLELMIKVAKN